MSIVIFLVDGTHEQVEMTLEVDPLLYVGRSPADYLQATREVRVRSATRSDEEIAATVKRRAKGAHGRYAKLDIADDY